MYKTIKLQYLFLLFYLQFIYSNEEFRATWVITWDHINSSAPAHINKHNVRQILDKHVDANMNAVIFQIRQSGTAYYNSSYEPWGYYAGYVNPGYDPLEFAIEEAHKRGLELHAWFNVFHTSSTISGSPAAEHPEWICRDQDGHVMNAYRSLSPGLKSVRDYTIDVAMEIVNNYDIDGLHLDYVRWSEHTSTMSGSPVPPVIELQRADGFITQEELNALSQRSGRYLYDYLHPYSAGIPQGYDSWESWWRSSVTEFVQTLHDSIQSVKPHVRLSAAVLGKYNWSGWQAYGTVFQDAALWFNEGYIDQLMPMHYHWTTASGFTGMLTQDCPECWETFLHPGIEEGNLFSVGPGSYILDENGVWDNHPSIINACRNISWVDGFQFFAYRQWDNHNYWTTASNSFFNKKAKIRAQNVLLTIPDQPQLSISYNDSTHVELTITPSASYPWVILYGEKNGEVNIDSEIKQIYFTDTLITYSESIDGLNSTDIIQFAATNANRYWQESELSQKINISKLSIPSTISVGNPSPNPFVNASKVSLTYSTPNYHQYSFSVYSLTGKQIYKYTKSGSPPGIHSVYWNGKNQNGNQVSSGVYFMIFELDKNIFKSKVALIR